MATRFRNERIVHVESFRVNALTSHGSWILLRQKDMHEAKQSLSGYTSTLHLPHIIPLVLLPLTTVSQAPRMRRLTDLTTKPRTIIVKLSP